MSRRKTRTLQPVFDTDEWVKEQAGDLCVLPPLEFCGAETPAGECIRRPHDPKLWCIAGGEPS